MSALFDDRGWLLESSLIEKSLIDKTRDFVHKRRECLQSGFEQCVKDWSGETEAVDEYLSDHPGIELRTFSWTNAPAAYLVKR